VGTDARADVLVLGALALKEHPAHFSVAQALDAVEKLKPRRASSRTSRTTSNTAPIKRNCRPASRSLTTANVEF
jgi:hypothetical protein